MEDVVADLRVMKIKQWTEKTKDKRQWRMVVEEGQGLPRPVVPRGWTTRCR
jgi:hypothetical protein